MTIRELVSTIGRPTACSPGGSSAAEGGSRGGPDSDCAGRKDAFAFDITMLKTSSKSTVDGLAVPQYDSPAVLRRWYNASAVEASLAYPVLSIGGVGTGLPFHTHGQAWLRLVAGMKLWLLVPPGGSPLGGADQLNWNPFVSTRRWLWETLCPLHSSSIHGESPGIFGEAMEAECFAGVECRARVGGCSTTSTPFIALQRAGDSIYLPAGWQHLTLNVRARSLSVGGEQSQWPATIALGGQAVWTTAQRESVCTDVLARSPSDYDCLKAMGIGLLDRLKRSWSAGDTTADALKVPSLQLGESVIR
jgi:hypothetical protein